MRGLNNHHLLSPHLREGVTELWNLFRREDDKAKVHRDAVPLLEQMSRDKRFLTSVLEHSIRNTDLFRTKNYPVIAVPIASNAHFDLIANCWIPLANGETNLSTKAIHHHGTLLLSTANIFGPGYEHWVFSKPRKTAAGNHIFHMDLTGCAVHRLHQVAFVDAFEPHCPFYPPSLTVTLALWSNNRPTGFKDHAKRIPLVKRNGRHLKNLVKRFGLSRQFDLKIVEFFDFFPVSGGFESMRERKEFPLGPEDDHVQSFLHVLQATDNATLVSLLEQRLRDEETLLGARGAHIRKLLNDLRAGRPIVGRLSDGHTGVPYANFTREAIQASLRDLQRKDPPPDARQFAASSSL